VFTLHESFPNPDREINYPPFELSEKGWGEFRIKITIHLCDINELPIEIFHDLAFHHQDPDPVVISEFYENIKIENPTISFYNILMNNEQTKLRPKLRSTTTYDDTQDLEKYQKVRNIIKNKIALSIKLYDDIQQKI